MQFAGAVKLLWLSSDESGVEPVSNPQGLSIRSTLEAHSAFGIPLLDLTDGSIVLDSPIGA
jgi:hypothetical protein